MLLIRDKEEVEEDLEVAEEEEDAVAEEEVEEDLVVEEDAVAEEGVEEDLEEDAVVAEGVEVAAMLRKVEDLVHFPVAKLHSIEKLKNLSIKVN